MTANRQYKNAKELLEKLETQGFVLSIPINVDQIAEKLKIKVIDDPDLEDRNSIGEISFVEANPVVRINPFQNDYNPRRRFTLAHEIGHYCLHSSASKAEFKDSIKTMSRSESYWDFYESEANGFAAQLLMPKSLLLKEGKIVIDSYKKDNNVDSMPISAFIEKMSSKFEVSNKAMQYRLKSLKIIS
jgi:Zn-dependent peptidase ImmA (M78 family)